MYISFFIFFSFLVYRFPPFFFPRRVVWFSPSNCLIVRVIPSVGRLLRIRLFFFRSAYSHSPSRVREFGETLYASGFASNNNMLATLSTNGCPLYFV